MRIKNKRKQHVHDVVTRWLEDVKKSELILSSGSYRSMVCPSHPSTVQEESFSDVDNQKANSIRLGLARALTARCKTVRPS
jgi:hypothetical protein